MQRITLLILLALLGQAHSEEVAANRKGDAPTSPENMADQSINKLSDKTLEHRALQTTAFDHANLDSSMLAKPGHVAVQSKLPIGRLPLVAPPRKPLHVANVATAEAPVSDITLENKGPDLMNPSWNAKGAMTSRRAKTWYIVDAEDLYVGRLATKIAAIAQGKHKPTYDPRMNMGDMVIVINADKVQFSGKKMDKNKGKMYVRYAHNARSGAGILGSQKWTSAGDILAGKFPERVLQKALHGMLPKSKLGKDLRHNVLIYKGTNHPYENFPLKPFPYKVKGTKGWVSFETTD